MERKQRLFIYDRKEMGVLILLGVMVALFAFTLGVHLGKRIGPTGVVDEADDVISAPTQPDENPDRQELAEQGKGVPQAADETLNQSLHDEVARTGIKLDTPRPVELPEDARSKEGGATTLDPVTGEVVPPLALEQIPAASRKAPEGNFTLQVGSHQTLAEARDQVDALEVLGMQPHLRPVDLKGKGRWYRVYLGGFATREEAENEGLQMKAKHAIESFLVSNRVP